MKYPQFKAFLKKHEQFLITSHVDPDGDATGSEYALLELLHRLGKRAVIFNSNAPERKFTFFDPDQSFHSLEHEGLPRDLFPFAVFVVDTTDLKHIGLSRSLLVDQAQETFYIDHHSLGNLTHDLAILEEGAAATCQIIYDLYEDFRLKPSLPAAYALFTGLVYDTGSFIYPKTTSHTFDIAKKLVELGVRPKEVNASLYETIPPSRMRLLAKVQATLRILFKDSIAVQHLNQGMLTETGTSFADADNFINYPLKCHTVKVSVLFKELIPGKQIKVSLRSKGNIDVTRVAHAHGGGGHRNAAGFTWSGPLDSLEKNVLISLETLILEDLPDY